MPIGVGLGLGFFDHVVAGAVDWRTVGTWDAYWAETVVQSGGNISQWTDGSGNGRHFVQSSAKPTVGGGFNGKPSIAFNGSTQYFSNAAALSSIVTNVAGYVCAVVKANSISTSGNPGYDDVAVLTDATNGDFAMAFDGTSHVFRGYYYDGTGEKDADSTAFATGVIKVCEMWWDGVHINSRVNGGTTTTTAAAVMVSLAGLLLCGTNYALAHFFDGEIGALAARKIVPSSGDRDIIAASMVTEFGAT